MQKYVKIGQFQQKHAEICKKNARKCSNMQFNMQEYAQICTKYARNMQKYMQKYVK